jgi:hypothetical protein
VACGASKPGSPRPRSPSRTALCAILNTAVSEDELIIVNPCRINGAGEAQATELPVLTPDQLYAFVDLITIRERRCSRGHPWSG